MKFTLTITDASAGDLAKLLATLGGSTAVAASPVMTLGPTGMSEMPPVPQATGSNDDDESGDTEAAAGTLDKDGLPWDERIHSTPAKLTGKGVWRKKRGVSDQLVNQVEAELRARSSAPAPQPVPTAAPQFTPPTPAPAPVQPQPDAPQWPTPTAPQFTPPPPMFENGTPAVPPQPAPAPTPTPLPMPQQQQPQPNGNGGAMDFSAFMQKIQSLLQMKDGNGQPLIDANYLNNIAQRVGQHFQRPVAAITDLASDPNMIASAVAIMQQEGKWQ